MKLKRLIAICLSAFIFSTATILVMGLWVVPQDSKQKVAEGSQSSPTTNQQSTSNNSGENPATPVSPNTTQPPTPSTPSTGSSTTPPKNNSTSTNKSSTPSSGGGGTSGSGGGTSTPPPPSQPACGSSGGPCSAAQVASHNSQGNCWVIYSGNYYIVTSYVNQHPGGTSVFNSSTCGHDITGYLNGSQSTVGQRKNHPGSAYSILNSYKVGPVQ